MHSDRLEHRRSHGSLERIPGTLARAMAQAALGKGFFPSKESLALQLGQELQSIGVTYHVRTLKRQISGRIATVPPEVEAALSRLWFNGNGRRSGDDIQELCRAAGISGLNVKDPPAYVLSDRVLPLVRLWLHLNPHASKRALAIRLQRDLRAQGVSCTVGSLEAILAGKNRVLIRALIEDKLLEYLREFGINSRIEAEARIETQGDEIRRFLTGRQLVPVRRFHQLCLLWLWQHRNASARQLSVLLRQKLSERGARMSLAHVENVVAGKTRQVRRLLRTVLEDLLQVEFPRFNDLQKALTKSWREIEGQRQDMAWVRAEPLVELAGSWLEQHPRMSKRQLAIRLSARIRELGYSRSHVTLQPILGGWKKKTRRFVYRAMLIECPSVKCLTKSCVYPAVREGLCRVCLLRKYDPVHFRGMSPLGGTGKEMPACWALPSHPEEVSYGRSHEDSQVR